MIERSPREAYRRIDFDARVEMAQPQELVALSYEKLVSALGTAIHAHDRGDGRLKSDSVTRALSAVMALRLGIRGEDAVSNALHTLYEGAGRTILDSVLDFDAAALGQLRDDFIEISTALGASPLAA